MPTVKGRGGVRLDPVEHQRAQLKPSLRGGLRVLEGVLEGLIAVVEVMQVELPQPSVRTRVPLDWSWQRAGFANELEGELGRLAQFVRSTQMSQWEARDSDMLRDYRGRPSEEPPLEERARQSAVQSHSSFKPNAVRELRGRDRSYRAP